MPRPPRFSFPMPADDVLQKVPRDLALKYNVLPIRVAADTMTVVTPEPSNISMQRELGQRSGLRIDARQVAAEEMQEALEYTFGAEAVKAAQATRGSAGAKRLGNTGSHPTIKPGQAPGGDAAGGSPKPGGGNPFDPPPPSGSYRAADSSQKPTRVPSEERPVPTNITPPRGLPAAQPPGGKAPAQQQGPGTPTTPPQAQAPAEEFDRSRRPPVDLDEAPAPQPAANGEPGSGETVQPVPLIERAGADEEPGGFGAVEDIRSLKEEGGRAEAIAGADKLLNDAIRMGASEVFVDSLSDEFLVRGRIEGRMAALGGIDRNLGPEVLRRLRSMAGIAEESEEKMATGRIVVRGSGGFRVDVFLRTFPGHAEELQVMDVIRFPNVRMKPQAPRGLSEGSPEKLQQLLAVKLGAADLAEVVTRQLVGPPTLVAVASSDHRGRESMMALLAGVIAGPSYAVRTIYVGERPRFYLEDQGVILLPCRYGQHLDSYRMATQLSADFVFMESCVEPDDFSLALRASASQHVIFGAPAADPVDLLVNLSGSPDRRRWAYRLGAILFMKESTMQVSEMTPPLREALATTQDPTVFERVLEKASGETTAPAAQSMELQARDVFNRAESTK